jgi:DNA-binding IclR family transcriptional regulator
MRHEMETNNGFCFLIHSDLAQSLGLSRRTIARHVKTLVNNGYLFMHDYDPMIFVMGNVYSATNNSLD